MRPAHLANRNGHWHGNGYRFGRLIAAALALVSVSALGALEVDRAELEKSRSSRVVFINYDGPHSRVESAEDIRSIGLALGKAIRAGAVRTGSEYRYFAVHSASAAAGDRLDADILGIGVDAGVDHIRNLRRILQGYLEGAYEYSAGDAALLAEFITIYNAVYRGNWDYFGTRYKDAARAELTSDKVGLSVRFDEWPGRALIVIPLAVGQAGSLSALDTSSLTEKKVVEELRKDDGRGVEPRKDMVDLKEREASEAQQKATLQREAIAQEEANIAADKAALAAEKEKIAAQEQAAAAATGAQGAETAGGASTATTSAGAGTPATATAPAAATGASATPAAAAGETAAAKEAVAAKEADLASREQALGQKKEEAAAAEALAAKKVSEAKAERADIAKDQQAVIAADAAKVAAAPTGAPAVRMLDPASPLGRVVLVDLKSGAELAVSALDTVSSRSVTVLDDRIVAIAGQTKGSGAVRLVALDPKTLAMTKQGADDIHAGSLVWINGAELYALVSAGGKLYLARFDKNLAKLAQSTVAVHPFAAPLFQGDAVTVQAVDGTPVLLNAGDLVARKQ